MRSGMSVRVVAVLALVGASGMAFGWQDGKGPLGGPKVKDGGVPGEHRRFVEGERGEGKDRARPIPQRAFMRAIEVLRKDEAGANKLTSEQDAKLKQINDQFREKADSFRAAHKDEVQKLIKDLPEQEARRARAFLAMTRGEEGGPRGEGRGEGRGERRGEGRGRGEGEARPMDDMPPPPPGGPRGKGPKGEEKLSPEAEKARERLREIMKDAPKLEEVHAQVFGVLTADQKKVVEQELERMRDEMEKRRGEMREDMDDRGGDKGEKGARGGERERMLERLTPEQREKLKSMSPEERRDFIRSIRKEKGGAGEKPKE